MTTDLGGEAGGHNAASEKGTYATHASRIVDYGFEGLSINEKSRAKWALTRPA